MMNLSCQLLYSWLVSLLYFLIYGIYNYAVISRDVNFVNFVVSQKSVVLKEHNIFDLMICKRITRILFSTKFRPLRNYHAYGIC